jgi:hypothetical protein
MFFHLVVAAIMVPTAHAASSKMDYLPFVHVRTDPVVTRNCLSAHVHTFYGAAVPPGPDITYADLRAACTTSGNVVENKSLYWHPTIYKVLSDGTYEVADIYFATAYYVWKTVAGVHGEVEAGYTQAFKEGFQMIADQLGLEGTSNPRVRAKFECADQKPCERTDSCAGGDHQQPHVIEKKQTFPTAACGELEIKIVFPTCSDGRLDSPDHMAHVAYDDRSECADATSGVDDFERSLCGECPSTHPIRIPEIQFYTRILNYDGGHYVFSNGSGFIHADYMNGWDETELQAMLDGCPNDSVAASSDAWCEFDGNNPNGLTFRDLPKKKNDERIRCMLDQIQPERTPVRPSLITSEATTGVSALPMGSCAGGPLEWAGLPAAPEACPTSMKTASECSGGISPLTGLAVDAATQVGGDGNSGTGGVHDSINNNPTVGVDCASITLSSSVPDACCTDASYCNGRGEALVPSHSANTSGVCFCRCVTGWTGNQCQAEGVNQTGSGAAALSVGVAVQAFVLFVAAVATRLCDA